MDVIPPYKKRFSLTALIEALIFVSSTPISIYQLSQALDETPGVVKVELDKLEEKYKQSSGLRLQKRGKKVQITTAPELSGLVETFLGIETTTKLSRAALETLAIIAFKQPITRPVIEEVRGVNSDGVVRTLLSKGLIEELGRSEGLGRAILYGTSNDFLSHFGLNSLDDLPAIDLPGKNTEVNNKILKD